MMSSFNESVTNKSSKNSGISVDSLKEMSGEKPVKDFKISNSFSMNSLKDMMKSETT